MEEQKENVNEWKSKTHCGREGSEGHSIKQWQWNRIKQYYQQVTTLC